MAGSTASTVNACLDQAADVGAAPIEVEMTDFHAPATSDFSRGVVDRDLLDRALRDLEPDRRALVVLHYLPGDAAARSGGIARDPVGHREVAVASSARAAAGTRRLR